MRVLLTGGAGFFGFHMANALVEQGHQVVLLDIARYIESDYHGPVAFHQGDVRHRPTVDRLMAGVDAVIHAAAALPLWPRQEIFSVNVEGTRTVLESALAHGVRRLVYISSTAVYGVPRKHPIEEDDPLEGVGPYGQSKIMAEQVCQEFRQRGLTITIIRPKTFIGPGRLGVFQILFDWVERGKPIPIIGAGHNRYQLLEVSDLTAAILRALTAPADRANTTFNIGAERFGTDDEARGAIGTQAGNSSDDAVGGDVDPRRAGGAARRGGKGGGATGEEKAGRGERRGAQQGAAATRQSGVLPRRRESRVIERCAHRPGLPPAREHGRIMGIGEGEIRRHSPAFRR